MGHASRKTELKASTYLTYCRIVKKPTDPYSLAPRPSRTSSGAMFAVDPRKGHQPKDHRKHFVSASYGPGRRSRDELIENNPIAGKKIRRKSVMGG